MSKAVSFVKLDWLTIKPFLTMKNLVLVLGLAVFLARFAKMSTLALIYPMVFGNLYTTYPFASGSEFASLDSLYAVLGIERADVVKGRYLYALTVNAITVVFSILVLKVTTIGMEETLAIQEILLIVLSMAAMYNLMQAIQIPILFSVPYAKAKFVSVIPFVLLPTIFVLGGQALKRFFPNASIDGLTAWIAANPWITAAIVVVTWIAILWISYRISLYLYRKRELE